MLEDKMKSGILIIAAFLFVLPISAFAQAPDTLWTRHYGYGGNDEAWQIKHTPDGGFVIVGFSQILGDIYLLKTDQNGDTLWTRSLGFLTTDYGRSVEPWEDGGYMITGSAAGYIVLMKTDSLGNFQWLQTFEIGYGNAVRKTSDGGMIIAGYSPVEDSSYNAYIAKTNSNGNLVWSKTYGGLNSEMAWDVREMPDNGFAIVGWTGSFGAGNEDIYLIRTDSNGDSLWTRTYGGIVNDEGRSLLVDENSNIIIAGRIASPISYAHAVVIKVSSDGNTIWRRTYSEFDPAIVNSICPTADGGYILTGLRYGFFQSSIVMKIDDAGNPIWYKILEYSEQDLYLRSILQTEDGGYVAAGFHEVYNHYADVFLVKLAPDLVGTHDEITILPDQTTLLQNYPNPFNASTRITFTLSKTENISLTIYNLLGRKIAVLAEGYFETGLHSITFNAGDLSSGVYFYNLKAGDISETKSMIFLK
jgi:hypothetical protein